MSPRSQRFGWALICYWGGIVFLGILKACFDTVASWRKYSTRVDVESPGSLAKMSRNTIAPFAEVNFWFKTHIIVPAAIGTRCQRLLLGCTIPQRSVSIAIAGFWCLCIILRFAGYPTMTNNTLSAPYFPRQVRSTLLISSQNAKYTPVHLERRCSAGWLHCILTLALGLDVCTKEQHIHLGYRVELPDFQCLPSSLCKSNDYLRHRTWHLIFGCVCSIQYVGHFISLGPS